MGRRGPEAPCPRELAAVFEDDAPLAVKPRLHLFYVVEIDQLDRLMRANWSRSSCRARLSSVPRMVYISPPEWRQT
jgi:hypothetical protein